MRFIVGLGNPGKDYEWSRHNLGFMLIDKLASDFGITVSRRECSSLVELVKPQTFMNLSGEAVCCLLAKSKCEKPGSDLIVISDDLALPWGKIRIRERGSAGGHNGLKSIIAALGTNEFVRLRIGIQPEHPVSDTKRFVLDLIPKAQRPDLSKIIEHGTEAVRTIIKHGVLKAMTEHN